MKQLKFRCTSTALVAVLFFFSVPLLSAATGEERIDRGIDEFGKGNYQSALLTFRDVILNSSMEEYHGEAYFWISRSYMAQQELQKAEQNLEFYLTEYEGHPLYPDALYQKGRLLHIQKEYEKSIRRLYGYIEEYPSHPYKANAYFWIGESLYALGHYEKADAIFTLVLRDYPKSYKVEAAKYRHSLIDLKKREEELLKLLKMSHEEYLKALEEFDRREKSYEQAIAGYQRKLAAATSDNDNELIDALNDELEEKNNRVWRLENETEELLELKNRALVLKEFLLRRLDEGNGGGQ